MNFTLGRKQIVHITKINKCIILTFKNSMWAIGKKKNVNELKGERI